MVIHLYKNSSENDSFTRDLSEIITFSDCTLRHMADVLTPVFELKTNTNISAYNYAYIPYFGRYYFIEITASLNGYWTIKAHVDVLYTYKSYIMNCYVLVERNENDFNAYLQDPQMIANQNSYIYTLPFNNGTPLNTDPVTLMTVLK